MNDQLPASRPTAEEVLHALRHFAQINSDEPFMWPETEPITAATTVAEFDLLRNSSGDLGRGLNAFLGTGVSDAEWEEVLGSPRQKTVGELCEFLSTCVALAPRERFGVLGHPCEAGSIFLTLKACLTSEGLNVRDLGPSTPISKYARDYPTYCTLVRAAVRIAPSRMPLSEPGVAGGLLTVGKLTAGCGLSLALGLLGAASYRFNLAGAVLAGTAALLLLFFAAFAFGYSRGWNRIPGVVTVRDLCKVLAGEPAKRPTRTKGLAP